MTAETKNEHDRLWQIHMVKRLASGDAVVLEAEAAALGDAASDRAVGLLRKAKSFYHDAQV